MPAARIRATIDASRPVTLLMSARLPAVVGKGPADSILSFINTGLPANGPLVRRWSMSRACVTAVGSIAMIERSWPSTARARAKAPSVSRSAVCAPALPATATASNAVKRTFTTTKLRLYEIQSGLCHVS